MRKRIVSLDCLRVAACVCVLLGHMQLFECGALGVSIFFVMSGFLMTYNYIDRPVMKKSDLSAAIRFGIKKTGKLYPLHLLMLVFMMGLEIIAIKAGLTDFDVSFIGKALADILLLQSLIPSEKFYYSFNNVSWYLSSVMIASMLFPAVLRKVRKCKGIREACSMILLMFVLQLSLCGIVAKLTSKGFTHWFSYIFPFTRLLEIAAGAYSAYIFIQIGTFGIPTVYASLLEVLSIALFAAAQKLFKLGIVPDHWAPSSLYFLPSVGCVFICAVGKGILTKLLTNRVTGFISDMSAYIYIVQLVVIKAVSMVIERLPISLAVGKAVYCITIPLVTVMISVIYSKVCDSVKRRRRV